MTKCAIAILSLFLLIFGIPHSAAAVKPRPPVELSLSSAVISEEETKITLTARANIETSSISLAIDLPLALTLMEGEAGWEGSMNPGDTQQVAIVVQGLGGIADEIIGNATLHLPNNGTFHQKTKLILSGLKEKSPKPLPQLRRKDGSGSVLEFRGR